MSDEKTKTYTDLLDAGSVPGESLAEFRERMKGFGDALLDSLIQSRDLRAVGLGNNGTQVPAFIAPYDLEITEILASKHGTVTNAVTATLVNRDGAGNTDKNPLNAANIDIDALTTANEAVSQTLSSTAANKKMKAGDCLQCTFAADGTGAAGGACVTVKFKPIKTFEF